MIQSTPVWAISDGAAGNARQAEALAAALGLPFESISITTRTPWRWLAPRALIGAHHAFGERFAQRLQQPLPSLVIGCGRQAALCTRLLRHLSDGHCRSVQILDPRIDPSEFDLLVAPAHDALSGANVIVTRGSLHSIDNPWLAQARVRFAQLGALPSPRIGVLLGGPTRAAKLDRAWWRDLSAYLRFWLEREGGSLMLSGSRRTPDWLQAQARRDFADTRGLLWFGDEDGPNPYPGVLAHAERLVVSPDSINMLSEACATNVPVLTHAPRPPRGRNGAFLRELIEAGRVRPMRTRFSAWPVEPLRELPRVAEEVRRRLGLDSPPSA
jgi:hypothetical protein